MSGDPDSDKWDGGDWTAAIIFMTIVAFGGGAFSCAKLATFAPETCRILAKEPDNDKITWDGKQCVRQQPPVAIDLGHIP